MSGAQRFRKLWPLACVAITVTTGLCTMTARAARLGHPAYSAAAATTAQRQINLTCDPVGAETGSTSTIYDPSVANINTITAAPGFEITEVDVLVGGDGTYPEQFIITDPNITSFVIQANDDALASAIATGSPTTYYADLGGAPEAGAVQVFWAPLGSTPPGGGEISEVVAAPASVKASARGGGSAVGDVVTHVITFDNVSTATTGTTTFTNYANGDPKFPEYFYQVDGYSGPGFSYVEGQNGVSIGSATATVKLTPCPNHGNPKPPCKRFLTHVQGKDGYGKGH